MSGWIGPVAALVAADADGRHYGRLMTLPLVGSDIVHMDDGTFMWIQLTHFAIATAQDDRSLCLRR